MEAFAAVYTNAPEQPSELKNGQMTKAQLDQFFKDGYVILEDYLDIDLLEKIKDELEKSVDNLAHKLLKAGKITNTYADKDLFTRSIYLNKEFPGVSVLHHKSDKILEECPSIKDLWSNEKLVDAIEQIIGPDIAGHPVWNLRIKLPNHNLEEVPWHQDNGYFEDDAQGTMICTAWIPLMDTSKSNGGMAMVRKTHQKGILGDHTCCSNGTWYIEMDIETIEKTFGSSMAKDEVECKVPYGAVLLFSNAIVHCSYSNTSNVIRWSMDLRWQDPKKPNGRPEPNDVMPIFRKDGEHVRSVDWSVMSDRHKNDAIYCNDGEEKKVEDEFDTRISGPWMKRWPIVHHNQHTAHGGFTSPTAIQTDSESS